MPRGSRAWLVGSASTRDPSGFHRESLTPDPLPLTPDPQSPDPRNCDPADSPDPVPGDTLSLRPAGFYRLAFVIRPGGRPCRTLNNGPARGSAPAATCDAARGIA